MLSFGVLTVGLAACQGADGSDGEDAGRSPSKIRVEVRALVPTSFEDRVEATGSLEADYDATLSARSAGTLDDLVRLGTKVKKGVVVARIDPGIPAMGVRQAEAARAAARASLALAEESFQRQKPLYEQGVISALEFQSIQAQYAQAKAQLAQAAAALAQAQESLSNTRLVAPFAGVVDAHYVEAGEQVSPGTRVVRVLDASTMVVKAGLPERYAADIQIDADVEVQLPAYGLAPRRGRVRFVATALDPRSRTFDIEVALENKDGRLKPEMVAKLVVTRARLEGKLVVPQDAILRDEAGPHVFVVVDEDGEEIARRRSVTTGGRARGRTVVSGVSAGDEVVVLGQTKLIDGDYVDVSRQEDGDDGKAQAEASR